MSDYDRYANTRYGAGLARSGVAVDQGLRAYMIGVYNYMTLGLGVTGLVAWLAFQFGTVQTEAGRSGADQLRPRDLRLAAALGDRALAAGAGVLALRPHQFDVGGERPQRRSSPLRR